MTIMRFIDNSIAKYERLLWLDYSNNDIYIGLIKKYLQYCLISKKNASEAPQVDNLKSVQKSFSEKNSFVFPYCK